MIVEMNAIETEQTKGTGIGKEEIKLEMIYRTGVDIEKGMKGLVM